jgi:hypothetical protein
VFIFDIVNAAVVYFFSFVLALRLVLGYIFGFFQVPQLLLPLATAKGALSSFTFPNLGITTIMCFLFVCRSENNFLLHRYPLITKKFCSRTLLRVILSKAL